MGNPFWGKKIIISIIPLYPSSPFAKLWEIGEETIFRPPRALRRVRRLLVSKEI